MMSLMNLQTFLANVLSFMDSVVVPFILALAFLVFVWNLAKYFIIQGDSDDGREKARRNAFWGILAFIVIVSIWGIVNILVRDLGFDRTKYIEPDYLKDGTNDDKQDDKKPDWRDT